MRPILVAPVHERDCLRAVAELLRWHGEGKLRPCITHRLPLERAVEGIRLLTDRQAHGKIVVELEPA